MATVTLEAEGFHDWHGPFLRRLADRLECQHHLHTNPFACPLRLIKPLRHTWLLKRINENDGVQTGIDPSPSTNHAPNLRKGAPTSVTSRNTTGLAGSGDTHNLTETRLRVCYVLAYRAPDYIRSRTMTAALQAIENVEFVPAINTSPGLIRYWQAIRALLHARRNNSPNVYILGFRGVEIAWLVRLLTRGKPLIIDTLMSPYASLSEEAKYGRIGCWLAWLWRPIEQSALRNAEALLTDTGLHATFLSRLFGLSPGRVHTLPVGADEARTRVATPRSRFETTDDPFRVLFFGSMLPLHGVKTIVEAFCRLTDLPIELRLIGGTPRQQSRLLDACRTASLQRVSLERWVPFETLLAVEIPQADLCLGGPFGGTPQARRVVTGKTSQCLALGKATVVGRIDEALGFVDRQNCLLVEQDDPAALADAIRWAFVNREALVDIGNNGQLLYAQRLSVDVVAKRLAPILRQLTTESSRSRHG